MNGEFTNIWKLFCQTKSITQSSTSNINIYFLKLVIVMTFILGP